MVGYAMPKTSIGDHLKRDLVIPNTVDELIDMLDEVYPDKSPSVHETFEQLIYRGGQRSVVDFINELRNRAEK